LFRILHEENNKHKGKRGYEELVREGRPRTSNAQISMAKRSRLLIERVERACSFRITAKGSKLQHMKLVCR
jgi:hypothetical protein